LNYELKKTSDKLEELGTLQTDRGDLADSPLGVNQHSSRNNPKLLINGSPKPLGVLRQKFGEMNTPKGRYALKIPTFNSLQLPESRISWLNLKNSGSTKNHQIGELSTGFE
jgi:hypothetical protein